MLLFPGRAEPALHLKVPHPSLDLCFDPFVYRSFNPFDYQIIMSPPVADAKNYTQTTLHALAVPSTTPARSLRVCSPVRPRPGYITQSPDS